MNKSRQKELTRWLKQQSVISQRWLNISRLLGFVSGILIIAQAWFMARILQHMIMENIRRGKGRQAASDPDGHCHHRREGPEKAGPAAGAGRE